MPLGTQRLDIQMDLDLHGYRQALAGLNKMSPLQQPTESWLSLQILYLTSIYFLSYHTHHMVILIIKLVVWCGTEVFVLYLGVVYVYKYNFKLFKCEYQSCGCQGAGFALYRIRRPRVRCRKEYQI